MKLDELNRAFEETMAAEENQESKNLDAVKVKKNKKWIFVIAAVLILGIFAFTSTHRFGQGSLPDEEELGAAQGGLVMEIPDEMKSGEYGDILQQQIDESMFTINVRAQPVFTNGSSKGVVDIVNNPSNKFPCKVVLTIDKTGEEVYRCDELIYPGQYINEIKLSKNLEKGAYPATLTYYVYNKDGKESIGVMNAGITIAIQN